MKYYLKEDVLSTNRSIYGYKGEVVSVIGSHDNCLTVESETGKKFGVNKNKLSVEKINKDPEIKKQKK